MSRNYLTTFVIFFSILGITHVSQLGIEVVETSVLLLSTIFFLILTSVTTVLYYRRIKGIKAKYEEAKNVVGDVVVSFNKQLKVHEEQLEKTGYSIAGLSARSDKIIVKMEELGKETNDLASKVAATSDTQTTLTKDIDDIRARLSELRKAQEDIEKHVLETSEAKIETAIPIRREHALAPLTETELRVLEFIAQEGERTAPEIKDLTKLTREHSARLVKKLYEEGYLERDIEKTPFKYRVKDEMLKILKKNDAQAQNSIK